MIPTLTPLRALAFAGMAVLCALGAAYAAWGAPTLPWLVSQGTPGCEHCGKAHKGPIDVHLFSPEWEAARMSVQHRLHDVPLWGDAEAGELMELVRRAGADAALVPATESSRGAELVHCWIIQEVGTRLSVPGACEPAPAGRLRSFIEGELSSATVGARFNAVEAAARAGMLTEPRVRSIVEGMVHDPDERVAEKCRRMISGAPNRGA